MISAVVGVMIDGASSTANRNLTLSGTSTSSPSSRSRKALFRIVSSRPRVWSAICQVNRKIMSADLWFRPLMMITSLFLIASSKFRETSCRKTLSIDSVRSSEILFIGAAALVVNCASDRSSDEWYSA